MVLALPDAEPDTAPDALPESEVEAELFCVFCATLLFKVVLLFVVLFCDATDALL